ncbi:MAG: ATP-binding protein [Nannocystaceae bacterium]
MPSPLDRDGPELGQEELRTRTKVLVDLAKRIGEARGDLGAALREITEVAARTLGVDRSSVWLYDEGRSAISCLDVYERGRESHSSGQVLRAADLPRYFEALESERAIAAEDARDDPRTVELGRGYLSRNHLRALLDAPIRIRGQMIGVLCHEHRDVRQWTVLEQSVSATFADFVGLAIEAHEHREQEDKAHRLEAQLRHAQKLESLGILAGGIAHDFNNLLVGILGNAGLALMELAPDSPVRPLVQDIQAAATRAAELAQEMLAYSGRGALKSEPVDLGVVVQEMRHLQRARLGAAEIDVELAPGLPPVLGDPTQLRRMIMNLITNAADAIAARGRGEGRITITITAVTVPPYDVSEHIFGDRIEPGRHLALSIRDNGVGMDPATRARIFDPFFTTKATGRGLGMAVVLGVVGGHRGSIHVESAPGRGTTITTLLPAAVAAASTAAAPPVAAASARKTILVADDEQIVRTVTRRVLERAGYRVLEAEDGQAALRLFAEGRASVCAVILDLTMPILSGQEVLARLRALDPDLPILLTSGFSQESLSQDLTAGARVGFLQKPFNPASLLATLDGLTRGG